MVIHSDGNVGIGTTSPSALLSVNAPAGQASFIIGSSTATSFIVDKSGNVGIGLTNPNGQFQVYGAGAGTSLTGTAMGQISALQTGIIGATTRTASVTFGQTGQPQALAVVGAAINNGGSSLYFGTSNNFGSGVTNTAMYIDNVGDVGIGTTSPLGIFDVSPSLATSGDGSSVVIEAQGAGNGAANGGDILFNSGQNGSGSNGSIYFAIGGNPGNISNIKSNSQLTVTYPNIVRLGASAHLQLPNNVTVQFAEAGGTYDDIIKMDASTRIHYYNPGGSSIDSFRINNLPSTAGGANTTLVDEGSGERGLHISTSAVRYKTNIRPLTLDEAKLILNLQPVFFTSKSPVDDQTLPHWGFIAEDTDKMIPEVFTNYLDASMVSPSAYPPGYNMADYIRTIQGRQVVPDGLQYDRMVSPIVKVLQDHDLSIQGFNLDMQTLASNTASSTPASENFAASFWNNLFAKVTTWLADAGNGIVKFFAGEVYTNKLCVKKSDGSDVCVTGDQLSAILASAASASPTPPSSPPPPPAQGGQASSTPDTIPPVLSVIGNNPAVVSVGSTYSDLGVNVTDNVDQNLGYTASLDGGPQLSQGNGLSLDTSTSTAHTIIYTATDQAGNVGTTTREVDVQ